MGKICVLVAVLALVIVAVQGQKPGKGCKGECQVIGTDCEGKVKTKGCEDGEECCMTGKKPGKPGKGCKGECQVIGTDCEGKVNTKGCEDGEECCMSGGKEDKEGRMFWNLSGMMPWF